ncbi:MAG TPA: NEW3 domain-containing protein [candidate division Zixibacteria bacterium]|nr:NEW3 domain-containing protein [candidate division Zixibacteria bacterium]
MQAVAIGRARPGRRLLVVGLLLAMVLTLVLSRPAAAQAGVTITTPFPAVAFQPGANVEFELTVAAQEAVRVDLAVEGAPEGWSASLSGGGNEVRSVFVQPNSPATVTLNVSVPDDAAAEPVSLTVTGRAAGETASLEVDLVPAEGPGGSVGLESDYPSLRGSTDQDFQFNLTLRNDTSQQLTFGLQASGPQGWEVSVQPSGEAQAASVTVDARGTQRLELTATPPPQATAGTYPLTVEAVAGEYVASAELTVEVTGTVELRLTTPNEQLNTTANAGAAKDFEVLVVNEGSAPLTSVELSGRGPSEWQIDFEPATIETIAPGESATATARITPSGNAVAGDYMVTMTAQTEGVNESMEVRVTVETPPIWGIVGILLIAAALGGLGWVFRRYGRR